MHSSSTICTPMEYMNIKLEIWPSGIGIWQRLFKKIWKIRYRNTSGSVINLLLCHSHKDSSIFPNQMLCTGLQEILPQDSMKLKLKILFVCICTNDDEIQNICPMTLQEIYLWLITFVRWHASSRHSLGRIIFLLGTH